VGFLRGFICAAGDCGELSICREVGPNAEGGGLVVGICNGFQVLTATGLLPGALLSQRQALILCARALRVVDGGSVTLGGMNAAAISYPDCGTMTATTLLWRYRSQAAWRGSRGFTYGANQRVASDIAYALRPKSCAGDDAP